ncbi:MAG: hypothetical protein GWN87_24955 [Desulfuromonadales bacterium]|nr:hypothetical protein [Desulfuromonadales bacterium]
MDTMTVNLTSTDGDEIAVNVPTSLPTEERAEELRRLWDRHVVELDGHWKGPVKAVVRPEIADDVAEAMNFMGAIVDDRYRSNLGRAITLKSRGYWAHGF